MRRLLLLGCCVLSFSIPNKVNASFPLSIAPAANNEAWKDIKATDVVKLTAKDFCELSGKKLTLKEKIAFSVMKARMKKESKKNPNLTVGEYLSHAKKLSGGWIFLIVVVGIILVIILAFFISGANNMF